MVAAVYMRVFLEDDDRRGDGENEKAMLIKEAEEEEEESKDLFKLPKDMIRLFNSRLLG